LKISGDGTQFEYRTDLVEHLKPRVLVFNLKVHAQGDGINGKTHTQLFPSTITIDGCAHDKINKVTHTWKVQQEFRHGNLKRKEQSVKIPTFTIDVPYCPFHYYHITDSTNAPVPYVDVGTADRNCNEANPYSTSKEFRNSKGYRGCQNKAIDGKTCMKWKDVPGINWNDAAQGLGDHNYCRNPDMSTNQRYTEQSDLFCFTNVGGIKQTPCRPILISFQKDTKTISFWSDI
jgi:hypothetical protein